MNKAELIAFEKEIADLFKDGQIRAPIHLSGGNEDQLIEIFKGYKKGDWIFSTWRNHYHWLLSGRSPAELRKQILAGDSMSVKDDKFFTSAIVGGIAPIAVGVAMSIKNKRINTGEHVWCFLGDMSARCGIALESIQYAGGHDLPVTFVIEDNGMSVETDTRKAWGMYHKDTVVGYHYKRTYPHANVGEHVLF